MPQIIDGKAISAQIKDEVKEQVAALAAQGKKVCLARSEEHTSELQSQR